MRCERAVDRSDGGVRFRLFPQAPFLHLGQAPELVVVPVRPGSIAAGPSDAQLYLIDPIGKGRPYGLGVGPLGTRFLDLPPWRGSIARPIQPTPDGHFDHVPVGSPEFERVHLFGALRFVLAIWEGYLGRPITWHFARDLERLEVSILPAFDNAHVGYGFMEVGAALLEDGTTTPFALNFDVIAHEFGHLLLYSIVGVPSPWAQQGEYFGFQEAGADLIALISALHFNSTIDRLLSGSRGNLYTFNELTRFAELSASTQIRLAANSVKASAFAAGWDDEHDVSQPLTGALFDVMIDVYQEQLVARGLITRELAELTRDVELRPECEPRIQAAYDRSYARSPHQFRDALVEARDYLGTALTETWQRLWPDDLDYAMVADALLAADRQLTGGRFRRQIVESFAWREIGYVRIGPRVRPPDDKSHAFSARTIVPEMSRRLPKMTFRERMLLRA